MSETNDAAFASSSSSLSCFRNTIVDSCRIFLRNKQIFFSIFSLLTLPLSLLYFSLSLSSRSAKFHIYHLEAVAVLTPTRFEARQVWKESRADALSLLQLKALYFCFSYPLSLIAAASTVSSSALWFHSKKQPTFLTAINAVKLSWKRVVATSIITYGLLVLYAEVPRVLATFASLWFPGRGLRLALFVIGSGIDIYLMSISGLGFVVSVLEERLGIDAVRVGSGLMEGRRITGWVLSGLGVAVSGWIRWKWEKVMDGLVLESENIWTVMISGMDKAGLILGYGLVMLWSYIVTTVFYCDCKKRHHVIRDENENESLIEI